MRERDYLFARDQYAQEASAAIGAISSTKNHCLSLFEQAIDRDQAASKDPINSIRAYKTALIRLHSIMESYLPDGLGKIWRQAKQAEMIRDTAKALRWKAAAIGINAGGPHSDIALSGMTPFFDGVKWSLAIPTNPPEPMAPTPTDYEPDDLILIDPKAKTAIIYGDAGSLLVLPLETDRFTVHACPIAWAREVATARVEWLFGKFQAQKIANITPVWTGHPPSALLIGDMNKVVWPTGAIIEAGAGIDAKKLQRAIYAQSRTSRVFQHEIRRVA